MNKWIFPILSTVAAIVISIVTYADLPERIAVHFNISEQPDNWMSKPVGAFILPALIVPLTLLVSIRTKFEKDENKRLRMDASIGSVMAIISAILLAVHCFTIAYNLGYDLGAATVATSIAGIMFILLGNIIPRLPRSSVKWPKLSVTAQRKASHFQGRLMMVIGFVILLTALLPTGYILPAFFVLIVIFIIVLISSTVHYSRTN